MIFDDEMINREKEDGEKYIKERERNKGQKNGMYGKKQSDATKQKISDAQKKRYSELKHALSERELFKYADTSIESRKEVLKHLMENNNLSFQSVQQAINFIAIMLQEDRLNSIIQQKIDELVNECKKG